MTYIFTHTPAGLERTKWGCMYCWPLSGEGDPMYSNGLQVLPVTVAQDAMTRLDPYYTSSWL